MKKIKISQQKNFNRKSKIMQYLKDPIKIVLYLMNRKPFRNFNDKLYLKLNFKNKMGKKLNLDNPKTFNEKLQWLKLYDRKSEYVNMVDKYEVKNYVANIIGEKYIIPTLGVYNNFDEIDFSKLPNQFVIKCTHDSGGLIICKDKSKFDKKEAKSKMNKSLKINYFYAGREWVYKNIQPRIIIEKYMEDKNDKELRDYKFYCFDGYVKAILVATNRQSDTEELCFDYFDNKYNHLNLTNHWHPNAKVLPHKPQNFDKMLEIASKLSKNIPHVRVDLYEVNNSIYFGELTFYDMGGYLKIHPDDWDLEWGQLIKL